jgi:hypothetical protein
LALRAFCVLALERNRVPKAVLPRNPLGGRRTKVKTAPVAQNARVYCCVVQFLLRVHLPVQGQTAAAHPQRGPRQVKRLVGLRIEPVHQDPRFALPRQRRSALGLIDRPYLQVQMPVTEQAIGALDVVAQRWGGAEAPSRSVRDNAGRLKQAATASNNVARRVR